MPPAVAAAGIVGAGSVISAREAKKGAKRQAEAVERQGEAAIAEQRAAREAFEKRTNPFVNLGMMASNPLLDELGIRRSRRRFGGPGLLRGPGGPRLPGMPEAFGPESFGRDNPLMQFLLEEGERGIEESGAGGGRNVDRDLAKFRMGTAASLLPQLQSQQFAQQGGLRSQAIAESQQRIANLMNLLGVGQSSAVGQGQAALSTAGNIGNILGDIGSAQAQAAAQKSAAKQNMIGGLLGAGGMLIGGGLNG